jgi:hypothetical protein
MRNLLATVPQGTREPIAAIVRTIFAQPDHASAMAQLHKVADGLRARFPKAAALLEEAAEDVLAYRRFPIEHQRQLHSTNVLERLNKEIKRRSNVVGIFPSPKSTVRLIGALLLEQDEEWSIAERRYFSVESMKPGRVSIRPDRDARARRRTRTQSNRGPPGPYPTRRSAARRESAPRDRGRRCGRDVRDLRGRRRDASWDGLMRHA